MNRLMWTMGAIVAGGVLASCGGGNGTSSPSAARPEPVIEQSGSLISTSSAAEPTAPTVSVEPPPPSVTYAGQGTASVSTTSTTTPVPTTTMPDDPCIVSIPADAFFESGGSTMSAAAQSQFIVRIAELAECLTSTAVLRVEAWTDDRGDADYNIALSGARAAEAVRVILSELPDLADRIIQIGHGEADPPTTCTGDCPANRVVTVAVVPAG